VVAEESGAAHFGFGGAMLPDLLGPMVRPPAAQSEISVLVNLVRGDDGARAVGATDDDASPVRRGASYGVSFATTRSQQLAGGPDQTLDQRSGYPRCW